MKKNAKKKAKKLTSWIERAHRNELRRRRYLQAKRDRARAALDAGAVADELAHHASFMTMMDLAQVPTDIQWMPPGRHTVTVSTKKGAKTMCLTIDEATARAIQENLAAHLARANSGEDDLPYLDFNHEDREAAAHVSEFYWGGDDPKKGGVRAKVQWTAAGRAAIEGRNYRRFSPSFYTDAKNTRVVGAPVNMGGLVNRAAFSRIAPVAAKSGDNTNQEPTMKNLMATLAKLGLVKDAEADEATAVVEVTQNHAKLAEEAASLRPFKAKAEELATRNSELEAEVNKAKDESKDARKRHAESVVADAAKRGALPPQDKELHAKWVTRITDDPAMAELIPAGPAANLAQRTSGTGNGQGGDIRNGSAEGGETLEERQAKAKEEIEKRNGSARGVHRMIAAARADKAAAATRN